MKTISLLLLLLLAPLPAYSQATKTTTHDWATLFPQGLQDAAGNPVSTKTLEGKIIGLYFSAHWCGPCRLFTPQLVQYRDQNAQDFEIVFISSDRSPEEQLKYMKEAAMKWATLPWRSPAANQLAAQYQVTSIPKLILLNPQGQMLTEDGRGWVASGGDIQKLKKARIVEEKYHCGNCDKQHTRQKLLLD